MYCPKYITALLEHIDMDLRRIMWNRNQEEYNSPFANSGNVDGYKNDTFEVHAYDWSLDESSSPMLPNFKYNDIEISWYKYLGRGMWINRKITPEEAVDMFNACMASLDREEKKDDDFYQRH